MPLKRKPERNRLVLSGESHPEWRETLEGFREVCVKDGLDASYELFKMIRDKFLVEHHWPPGNPQTVLDNACFPRTKPPWETCLYAGKILLNGMFQCEYPKSKTPLTRDGCSRRAHKASRGMDVGCYQPTIGIKVFFKSIREPVWRADA